MSTFEIVFLQVIWTVLFGTPAGSIAAEVLFGKPGSLV
jgi:hypothetical protein